MFSIFISVGIHVGIKPTLHQERYHKGVPKTQAPFEVSGREIA